MKIMNIESTRNANGGCKIDLCRECMAERRCSRLISAYNIGVKIGMLLRKSVYSPFN